MKTILTTTIYLLVIILISLLIRYACNKPIKAVSSPVERQTIPSPTEIQQMLKDTGVKRYDPGKIDGKIGRQTMRAWNNYTCDQFAIQTFKPEYYEVRK